MFEENTKQVNEFLSRLFIRLTPALLVLAGLSALGIFEFGTTYCILLVVTGCFVAFTPRLLIRRLPPGALKHYMIFTMALFIGILATNNKIGVNITYLLAPLLSCLYFDPKLVLHSSALSYVFMIGALYSTSADKLEVTLQGRSRFQMFVAFALGYTIEYVLMVALLIFLVRRARLMMEKRYNAEEASRTKSAFLSRMSHEIRTPMNAILGMTEVALRGDLTPELRRCLSVIQSSASGLLEIINDILDLSRVEAGKLNILTDTYSTAALAEELTALVDARNTEHKVPIHYHIQPDMPPWLQGDVVRLRQVMLNFASNAIKYTDHGSIDITLRCTTAEDRPTLYYSVTDTGQGIRPEDQPQLFTPYTQFNPRQNHGKESSGIGLTISKRFVDAMGGSIQVESRYGVGSTFAFTVPQKLAAPPPQAGTPAAAPTVLSYRAPGVPVLLVDDNTINREVLKALLEPVELDITEADNGRQAVAQASHTPFALIFMDSHMPVMDGAEATRLLRSSEGPNQHTPVIALTADAISGVREQLLQSGMNDYITKPIDLTLLDAVLRKYLPAERIQPMEKEH